ncbi:YCF48-related protein [Pseudomonas stutzeri]|nr:YCF48-related protein [Stutzerimonas stutzeri]
MQPVTTINNESALRALPPAEVGARQAPGRSRIWIGLGIVGLVAAGTVASFLPRPAPAFPPSDARPELMLINGAAQAAGAQLVAAGELGHLFHSPGVGQPWSEATVAPQRGSTLTQVLFADPSLGLAVGHDNWILRSEDGGLSWQEAHFDGEAAEALMGVWGTPRGPLFAVGSFGRLLVSDDRGRTWQPRDTGLGDRHFYGIAGAGGQHLMLVGESGLVARSTDGGQRWERLPDFYNGSFFGLLALSASDWLVYGMRGKVFRTADFGASWQEIDADTGLSLYGGTRTGDGRVVLVGEGGVVTQSADGGRTFRRLNDGGAGSLSGVAELADGRLIFTGQAGIAVAGAPAQSPTP